MCNDIKVHHNNWPNNRVNKETRRKNVTGMYTVIMYYRVGNAGTTGEVMK